MIAEKEFLANMSHELRTPLTGVLAMTEALQTETFGDLNERQHQLLRRIEDGGRRLLEIVNDILDLSQLDGGTLELAPADCMLEPLCRSCLAAVAPAAAAKRQAVHFSIEPQALQLAADPRRLRQMLINLLDNAVKFTPECGTLGLQVAGLPLHSFTNATALPERAVRFVVWDTGIGIAPEAQARLFQPFAQIDGSLTRRHAGTGLGLVLVKRMAELHGGCVGVESVRGQGSRFCITLPWRMLAEARSAKGA
jgi:signal transduction histidine kinase